MVPVRLGGCRGQGLINMSADVRYRVQSERTSAQVPQEVSRRLPLNPAAPAPVVSWRARGIGPLSQRSDRMRRGGRCSACGDGPCCWPSPWRPCSGSWCPKGGRLAAPWCGPSADGAAKGRGRLGVRSGIWCRSHLWRQALLLAR